MMSLTRRRILKLFGLAPVALTVGPLLPAVPIKAVATGGLIPFYVSDELLADVRNWGADQVDADTRREIYICAGKPRTYISGARLHV